MQPPWPCMITHPSLLRVAVALATWLGTGVEETAELTKDGWKFAAVTGAAVMVTLQHASAPRVRKVVSFRSARIDKLKESNFGMPDVWPDLAPSWLCRHIYICGIE